MESQYEKSPQGGVADQRLRCLQPSLRLAEKMGKRLGPSQVLQRAVPR
jgi:hypothetical protein